MEQGATSTCVQLAFDKGVLRSWTLQDAPQFAKHANNRNVWINCSDRWPSPYTEQDAVAWIKQCIGSSSPQSEPHPAVVSQLAIQHKTGGVIGGIGVFHRQGVQRLTKELGFWLGEDFWGQGIGSAAVGAFIPYVWAAFPDAVRLEALVYDYNTRSCRLLERLGFQMEGRLRCAAYKADCLCDTLVMGLLRPEQQLAA